MAFTWTDANVAKAKRLYITEGKSAAETAGEIGQGCTRNAVIGKAHRAGWLKEHRQKPAGLGKPRAPTVDRPKYGQAPRPGPHLKPGAVFGSVQTVSPIRAIKQKAAAAEARKALVANAFEPANDTAIPLIERRFGQCSWPVGEPERPADQLCCGQPVDKAANKAVPTYCVAHGRKAMTPKAQTSPRSVKEYERSLRRWAA